jgi:hypothetical protein
MVLASLLVHLHPQLVMWTTAQVYAGLQSCAPWHQSLEPGTPLPPSLGQLPFPNLRVQLFDSQEFQFPPLRQMLAQASLPCSSPF